MQPEGIQSSPAAPDDARRDAPELIHDVIEALPVGIGLFAVEGEEFVFHDGNREFVRLLALDRPPREGQLLDQVFERGQRDGALDLLRRVRASREPGTYFATEGLGAGSERIWNLDAYPVQHPGGPVTHIVMLVQETNEKVGMWERQERETKRLRAKAEQLADLEKAKSEFLHLASHELRGPAAMLRGYLSMIEDGSLGTLPPAMMPILPVLKAKAAQINMLANEMVEAARLEDRRLQLKLKRLDLIQAARRSVRNAEPTLTPRHNITVEEPGTEGLFVQADAMRLDIVIGNLIDNAIKFSPEGGAVTVRVLADPDVARVTVQDQGIGIAREDMDRLFVRFSRLNQRPDVPGTGLGLYLARELARLHGGDIVAVSSPGQGSTFTLSLPIDHATN
ncbi:MAG: PAS domain-containing sensor histidine kinase [Candidatus Dormibacteraeota bacterium]|nr:PAS domain-containing sensor histidine kinase [Candidatus Dormibacteraeota bacterium]